LQNKNFQGLEEKVLSGPEGGPKNRASQKKIWDASAEEKADRRGLCGNFEEQHGGLGGRRVVHTSGCPRKAATRKGRKKAKTEAGVRSVAVHLVESKKSRENNSQKRKMAMKNRGGRA